MLSNDQNLRKEMADGIEQLVVSEPGATHPVSDRYAVSLVLALLVLQMSGRSATAKKMLVNTAVFVGDRYEEGFGLGSVDATLDESVQQLLGYPFEVFDLQKESSSFLATALSDAAAFLGDPQLYSDIVNDFKACRIIPQYWQCKDTEGQFELDSEDVIQYPSIDFNDELSPFENFDYAQHIRYEQRSFSLFGKTGFAAYAGVALLLRDRYFPSLWVRLAMLDKQAAK